MAVSKEHIIEGLKLVIDPEVQMDIWTMGLVYDIDIQSEDRVHFVITYTSPFCPAGPNIQDAIREQMLNLGFEHVTIEVTFEPPWEMPEALRTMLGL